MPSMMTASGALSCRTTLARQYVLQADHRPQIGIGAAGAGIPQRDAHGPQRLNHGGEIGAMAIIARRLRWPAVRLVMPGPAVRCCLAVGTEPDDGAARPDQMRRQVGGRRERGPFLHQAIALAR